VTESLLPVTVIGGYLGAGKTTLVNHLLRHANGLRIAVLVNEFGELPIDADLIQGETEEGFISIAGGCICCSYGSDLMEALAELPALKEPPDHVLIEASGVALPGAVASSLTLLQGFRIDGVAVLADAQSVRTTAKDKYLADTIERQLADAELVLMTKVDLVERAEVDALHEWLKAHTNGARIVEMQNGAVDPQVLLGVRDVDAVVQRSRDNGDTHDTSGYGTHHFHLSGPVDVSVLGALLAAEETGLLRAKGFVRSMGGQMTTLQVVGSRWESSPAPVNTTTGLVCIGIAERMDTDAVGAWLAGCGALGEHHHN
jgi:G3E family GTPase